MKKIIILSILSLAIIFLAGCAQKQIQQNQKTNGTSQNKETQPTAIEQPDSTCIKEENCCLENSDCQYIWYTGGCNTPEYVAKRQKEAANTGMHIGEAPRRENVTCSCEDQQCVTHN